MEVFVISDIGRKFLVFLQEKLNIGCSLEAGRKGSKWFDVY